MFQSIDEWALQAKLNDTLLGNLHNLLKSKKHTECFLILYKYAMEGKLKSYQTFIDICNVMADYVRHLSDNNSHLKYGQQYPQNYLNFMTLLYSYSQNSAYQYGILTAQIMGPLSRHV